MNKVSYSFRAMKPGMNDVYMTTAGEPLRGGGSSSKPYCKASASPEKQTM